MPALPLRTPSPVAGRDDETASAQPADEEEVTEERKAAGTAWPLTLDQDTRDQLAAAARTGTDATEVATRGTIYYGVIYGENREADTYYVVASLEYLHMWSRQGTEAWRYRGVYDARVCAPPVPQRLYSAWGLSFSTKEPGVQTLCPT
ncbi:hypothetical protein [Sphaerisporangium fuscum]|uniref:hypothetical protein n=1 Tax=Sphaerisporangium fuscum TaxID=2835868 RepID=UPI001BDCCB71|nr:hypothetical protein [Sphaerisporangium fuscum]